MEACGDANWFEVVFLFPGVGGMEGPVACMIRVVYVQMVQGGGINHPLTALMSVLEPE